MNFPKKVSDILLNRIYRKILRWIERLPEVLRIEKTQAAESQYSNCK